MKKSTKIVFAFLAILVLIQFVRPEKNLAMGNQPNDIFAHHPASAEVQGIFKKACYDCHSNNTQYPWYANVQPLAWWINDHVEEGKGELNFSEFATYKPKKARHKLDEVAGEVDEHEMPLKSYTWIHAEAKLTDSERKLVIDWAKSTRDSIQIEE